VSEELRIVTVKLPMGLLKAVREVMEHEGYATLSEAIREALREWLERRRSIQASTS
jgi:Arc/MetJ-type ribon-helix-helix transcriptional regulator